jgi:hypothetical protein
MRDARTKDADWERQRDQGERHEDLFMALSNRLGHTSLRIGTHHYVDAGGVRVCRPDIQVVGPRGPVAVEVKYEHTVSWDIYGHVFGFSVEGKRSEDYRIYGDYFQIPVKLVLAVESGEPTEVDRARARKYRQPPPPDAYPTGVYQAPIHHLIDTRRKKNESTKSGAWYWFHLDEMDRMGDYSILEA